MPAYKDDSIKKNPWFVKFQYKDNTGKNRTKKKRGFATKREALAYEREFLLMQQGSADMTLESLVDLYRKHRDPGISKNTVKSQETAFKYILPQFGKMQVSEITPAMLREWQTEMKNRKHRQTGEPLKGSTLRKAEAIFSNLFIFAVRFYGLSSNPFTAAGHIKVTIDKRIDFWTKEEFDRFIGVIDEPQYHCIYMTLFYTGMRVGECLALTKADIDLENNIIDINKHLKTEASRRSVTIPQFLADEISRFIDMRYDLGNDDQLFTKTYTCVWKSFKKYITAAEVKKIRVHDLRHSHASLLINMGMQPIVIADRLGHADIQITLNTYSHLYPTKQKEVSDRLNDLFNGM